MQINRKTRQNLIDALTPQRTANYEGHPTIQIQTQQDDNGYIAIRISDNGPGIPQAVQTKIFDPFFTTKPVGAGSGLGLSVVYGFVQDSGGRVEVNDGPDGGTSVSLLLPERRGAIRPR